MTGRRLSGAARHAATAAAAALVVALGALLLPGADPAPGLSLRVVTYNICGQSACRSGLDPQTWTDTLTRAVTDYDADVVNLQEVCSSQAARLQDALRGTYTVHFLKAVDLTPAQDGCNKWSRDPGGTDGAFGAAVLVRSALRPVFHDQVLEPVDPTAEKRPLSCANLTTPADRRIQVCGAHLQAGVGELRENGLPTVLDRMRYWADGAPSVLAGDFNADPTDPNLGILYAAQDGNGVMAEADERNTEFFDPGCRPRPTCRSGGPTTDQGRKFDYIFSDPAFGPATAERVQVPGPDGSPLSDHLMYRASLPLRPAVLVRHGLPAAGGASGDGDDWANAVDRTAGDFTRNRAASDLVLRFQSGVVMLYPGRGDGTFAAGRRLVDGLTDASGITAGDFNGDADADLLVRTAAGGAYILEGDGAGHLGAPLPLDVPGGLADAKDIGYGQVLGPASHDLVVRWGEHISARPVVKDPATGRYSVGEAVSLRPGGAETLPDAAELVTGDFTGDRRTDLLIRRADGTVMLHPGRGDGTFPTSTQVSDGRDWLAVDHLTAGRFDGDDRDDLLVFWMVDHGDPRKRTINGTGQTEFVPTARSGPHFFGPEVLLKQKGAGNQDGSPRPSGG